MVWQRDLAEESCSWHGRQEESRGQGRGCGGRCNLWPHLQQPVPQALPPHSKSVTKPCDPIPFQWSSTELYEATGEYLEINQDSYTSSFQGLCPGLALTHADSGHGVNAHPNIGRVRSGIVAHRLQKASRSLECGFPWSYCNCHSASLQPLPQGSPGDSQDSGSWSDLTVASVGLCPKNTC